MSGWSILGPNLVSGSGAVVSFQRYFAHASMAVATVASSLGALPVGEDEAGDFLVPVPEGEAVWIGIVDAARDNDIIVMASDGDARDIPRSGRAAAIFAGLPLDGGAMFMPFAPWGCDRVTLRAAAGHDQSCALIRFVAPDAYVAATGRTMPAGARLGDGYAGARLP